MKILNFVLIVLIASLGCFAVYYVSIMRTPISSKDGGDEEEAHGPKDSRADDVQRADFDMDMAKKSALEYATTGPRTLQTSLSLPGEIALDGDAVVHVVPRLSGVAREVPKKLGDDVHKGELLATIDSRELADMKSEYLAALEKRSLAQSRFERERDLFDQKISPQEDFLSARQALAEENIRIHSAEQKLGALGISGTQLAGVRSGKETSLTAYPLLSPIDGTVIEKRLSSGEAIKDDADCFVLADLSSVWAEIVVKASDLKRIHKGQQVKVRSEDLDLEAQGQIAFIGALMGEQTRTARAVVDVPNPDRQWRPGLFVTVLLKEEDVPVALAVPLEAVQTLGEKNVVFVKEHDVFEAHPVTLGRKDAVWVEILEGLTAGQEYVAKGSFLIKADIGKSSVEEE